MITNIDFIPMNKLCKRVYMDNSSYDESMYSKNYDDGIYSNSIGLYSEASMDLVTGLNFIHTMWDKGYVPRDHE
ncbi:MAG: hypothetical protein GY861_05750 [bacterium]|nr:hypothetical protein [bacterium]